MCVCVCVCVRVCLRAAADKRICTLLACIDLALTVAFMLKTTADGFTTNKNNWEQFFLLVLLQ